MNKKRPHGANGNNTSTLGTASVLMKKTKKHTVDEEPSVPSVCKVSIMHDGGVDPVTNNDADSCSSDVEEIATSEVETVEDELGVFQVKLA